MTKRTEAGIIYIQEVGGGWMRRLRLKEGIFPNISMRAFQKVMQRWVAQHIVARETIQYRRIQHPPSEPVYILAENGIIRYAELKGAEDLHYPTSTSEPQLRKLKRSLTQNGITWLRHLPTIGKLEHDANVVDLKLKLISDVARLPFVTIEEWINEIAFKSPKMDKVQYTTTANGKIQKHERGVCPDGYAKIIQHPRTANGAEYILNLLIEYDNATLPVRSRFAREKAAPYAQYVGSPALEARIGAGSKGANWLLICRGSKRMENVLAQTQQTLGENAKWFLFSTLETLMAPENCMVTSPVWLRPRRQKPIPWALLTGNKG